MQVRSGVPKKRIARFVGEFFDTGKVALPFTDDRLELAFRPSQMRLALHRLSHTF